MKMYKIVREIRTGNSRTTNESEPMRYADGMAKKESMMARDRYYNENTGFINRKKWVYWLRDVSAGTTIKVHLVRA